MTEIHDKKFIKFIEEMHEKKKQSYENMRTIRKSVKSIKRYFFVINVAILVLFTVILSR